MCEKCVAAAAAAAAKANTNNGSPVGAQGSKSTTTFKTSFTGVDQSNMLALIYGQQWDSNNITFSFPDQASDYGSYPSSETGSFSSLNTAQKNASLAAFTMLEGYSTINFNQLSTNEGGADIRISKSGAPSTAWAYLPSNAVQAGDVWIGQSSTYNSPIRGTYAWHTILHEIGHALGLKHGHENTGYGALDASHNEMAYSLMTYMSHTSSSGSAYTNEYYGYAQTYMVYDIAAIQAMYGVNWSTNSGDSTYTWSSTSGEMFINGIGQGAPASNRIFSTIWDGGGTDTIDLSNYSGPITGTMNPGEYLSFSSIQKAQLSSGIWADGNIYFALAPNNNKKAFLENLILSTGDDFIFANKSHNVVEAKGGKDFVKGLGGHDTLLGGGGKDKLVGGPGADILNGGIGGDRLKGSGGADLFVLNDRSGKDVAVDFVLGLDYVDVPDTSLATLTVSNTGHLTVEYLGSWMILRHHDYNAGLDPLDYVI